MMTALFALPVARGRFLRFVGRVDQLPVRPFWDECFAYEEYLGNAKPSTLELCKRLEIDVLFVIHVQRNARGKLFLERMEEIRNEVPADPRPPRPNNRASLSNPGLDLL